MQFRNWHPKFLERYRKEGDVLVIEIALQSPVELYEDKDPSPLRARDLRPSVENYLINNLREIPFDQKVRIDFCFYDFDEAVYDTQKLKHSVIEFFRYRAQVRYLDFRFKIKNGIKSLGIGLAFLFTCIYLTSFLVSKDNNLYKSFFVEGLSVLGWVSLWNPVQIFLYEIWPIISHARSLTRCSKTDMTFKSIDKLAENREYIPA